MIAECEPKECKHLFKNGNATEQIKTEKLRNDSPIEI